MTNLSEFEKIREEIAQAKATHTYLRTKYPFEKSVKSHKQKFLYFAVCGDAVKIGVSDDPQARLEILQTGAPKKLRLIANIPNAGHREAECHKALAHLHLQGEWFWHTEEVDHFIKGLQ